MNLETLALHLSTYTNCFNSVAVASTMMQATTLLNVILPAAVIIPLESSATENISNMMTKQFVSEVFSVIVALPQTTREGLQLRQI